MTDSSSNILLLAGDGELRRRISLCLDGHGYQVDAREPVKDALSSIEQCPPQLIICCSDPLGPLALESLRALRSADPASGFILITGTPESEIAATAQHEGAILLSPSLPATGQYLAMVRTAFKLRNLVIETQTLKETLQQLADETTKRQGLEEELARSHEVRLLQSNALTREDDRKRLSEELHDDIMTPLAAIGVDFGLLRRKAGNIPQETMEDLTSLGSKIKDIDIRLRQVIWGIYPSVLTNLGLVPALRSYMEELSRKPISGPYPLEIELRTSGFGNGRLSEDLEIGLYRIVQHGVSNAIQHAQARNLYIDLTWKESDLLVQIADDGVGFDLAKLESIPPSGRLGMITLQDRITTLQGKLELESPDSTGATIRVHIPAPPAKSGDAKVQTLKYVLGIGEMEKEAEQD